MSEPKPTIPTGHADGTVSLGEISGVDSPERAKHTPGPWKWRRTFGSRDGVELVHPGRGLLLVLDAVRHGMSGADIRFARRSDSMGGLMHKATSLIADGNRDDFHDIDNPDARLIAAAPDLYSSAKAWIDWMDAPGDGTDKTLEEEQAMITAIRAAIAKARGEA